MTEAIGLITSLKQQEVIKPGDPSKKLTEVCHQFATRLKFFQLGISVKHEKQSCLILILADLTAKHFYSHPWV